MADTEILKGIAGIAGAVRATGAVTDQDTSETPLFEDNTAELPSSLTNYEQFLGMLATPEQEPYETLGAVETQGQNNVVREAAASAMVQAQTAEKDFVANLMAAKGVSAEKVKEYYDTPLPTVDDLKPIALEDQGIENVIASALADNDALEVASVMDLKNLDETKKMLTAQTLLIKKSREANEDFVEELSSIEGVGGLLESMSLRFIPLAQESIQRLSFTGNAQKFWSGDNVSEQRRVLNDMLVHAESPLEQYSIIKNVDDRLKDKLDSVARQDFWHSMVNITEADEWRYNTEMVVDAVPLVGAGASMLKGAASILSRVGSKVRAVEYMSEVFTKAKRGLDVGDELRDSLETAVPVAMTPNLGADITEINSSAPVAETIAQLKRNDDAVRVMEDTLDLPNMSPDAVKDRLPLFVEDAKKNAPSRVAEVLEVHNLRAEKVGDGFEGVFSLGAGKKFDRPVASKQYAEMVAKQAGLEEGTYKAIKGHDGWTIRYNAGKIPRYGLSLDPTRYSKAKPAAWKRNGITRLFFPNLSTEENIKKVNRFAVKRYDALKKKSEALIDPLVKLKRKDLEAFETLQKKSLNDEKWYNLDDLKAEGYSDETIAAYDAFQKIDEYNYHVTNSIIRSDLDEAGYKTVTIKQSAAVSGTELEGEVLYAVPDPKIDNPGATTFKEFTGEGKYWGTGEMSSEKLQELYDRGYRVFKARGVEEFSFNEPARYIIAHSSAVKVDELDSNVVAYVQGGRRIYKGGPLFIKTGRTATRNGKTYELAPKTLRTAYNRTEAGEFVKECEAVTDIVKRLDEGKITKVEAVVEAQEKTMKFLRVTDEKALRALVRSPSNPKGLLQIGEPIQVLEDGEELVRAAKGMERLEDPDAFTQRSIESLIASNNRLFRYKRGEALVDIGEDFTPTVDALDVAERTLSSAIHADSFSNYTKYYADSFVQTYGQIFSKADRSSMTPTELLLFGEIPDVSKVDATKTSIIKAAQAAREQYGMITMRPSGWDKTQEKAMKVIARTLADSEVLSGTGMFDRGTNFFDKFQRMKPTKKLRAMAYEYYLGMYNPIQYIKQASATSFVIAAEPRLGMKATGIVPFARMYKANPNAAKQLAKGAGIKVEELDEIMDMLNKTNEVVSDTSVSGSERVAFMDRGFRNNSTVFFQEGERFNKLSAAITSFLKWKQKNPGVVLEDIEDILEVSSYTDTLYMNMSKASENILQRGWKNLPTAEIFQFSGFKTRFLENMIGNELTFAQKSRIATTQLLLTGSRGFLSRKSGLAMYRWMQDKDLGDEEFRDFIHEGALDFFALDHGVAPGQLMDVQMMEGILDRMSSMEDLMKIPEVSSLGVLGKIGECAKVYKDYLWQEVSTDSLVQATKVLATRRALPSSMNYAVAGFVALNTGKYFSSKGQVVQENIPTSTAIMIGLGVPLEAQNRYSDQAVQLMMAKDKVNTLAKELEKQLNIFVESGDKLDLEVYKAMRLGVLSGLNDTEQGQLDSLLASSIRKHNATGKGLALQILKTSGLEALEVTEDFNNRRGAK